MTQASTTKPKGRSPQAAPATWTPDTGNFTASKSKPFSQTLARLGRRPTFGPFAGLLIVFGFFAIFAGQNNFLSLNGTASWVNAAAELGVVALPVGLLLIAGEFDLSIASTLAASSLIVAIATTNLGLPLIVSIVIALVFSALVGLLNGYLVTKTGLPSFIITIGTMFALAGTSLTLVRVFTGTTTVSLQTDDPVLALFGGNWNGFNASVLWFAAIAIASGLLLSGTRFGNWIFAVGGDKESAREAGVPVRRVKMTLFVFTALGAGLLGVIQAAAYQGASVGQGQTYIFSSLVAAVIGGVLLNGGYGTASGIVFGTMTFAIVQTGVNYTGWASDLSQVFIGVLVLIAVVINDSVRRALLRSTD